MRIKNIICLVLTASSVICAPTAGAKAFAVNDDIIYETDFEGFESGAGSWDGISFRNAAKTGGIVGAKVDSTHGTSAKIVDLYASEGRTSYTIDGTVDLPEELYGGKYVMAFDIYPVSWTTSHFTMQAIGSGGEGANVLTMFGRRVKAGGRYDSDSGYNITLPLGTWSRIQIYMDLDKGTYITYVNGTACERERSLKLDGGLTGIYFNTFLLDKANHGDIYIDDLSVYITETAVNAAPVDYEVRVKEDRTADVVFSDNVDPALFNGGNVKLSVSGGPETPADIVDASYFGFTVSLPEISESGMYRIDLENIKGLGGMELTKNSVVFPDVPGTYSGAAAENNVFEAVVGSDTVRVINTAGINGGYTLIVGYYKNSALEKVQSFSGVASERRPEDVFEIDETDGYGVRAFLILDDMSDMFFGQV